MLFPVLLSPGYGCPYWRIKRSPAIEHGRPWNSNHAKSLSRRQLKTTASRTANAQGMEMATMGKYGELRFRKTSKMPEHIMIQPIERSARAMMGFHDILTPPVARVQSIPARENTKATTQARNHLLKVHGSHFQRWRTAERALPLMQWNTTTLLSGALSACQMGPSIRSMSRWWILFRTIQQWQDQEMSESLECFETILTPK
jgi:hypothetical protein